MATLILDDVETKKTPTSGDPMPRFAVLSVLLNRLGSRGALDNVTDVLTARAKLDAHVAELEARFAHPASGTVAF